MVEERSTARNVYGLATGAFLQIPQLIGEAGKPRLVMADDADTAMAIVHVTAKGVGDPDAIHWIECCSGLIQDKKSGAQ